jgi:hypothetical protein
MKQKLLLTSIGFCTILTSFSQGFHLGAKAGANINKIEGQSFTGKFNYGYHAGAFAEIKLGKKFSLQPEVLFNQLNTDTSSKFSQLYNINADKISSIKLSYLSIPLLLNYNLSKSFSIQAGPQYGILIDQNSNLLQNGKNAFKQGDFSMLAGVQLKFSSIRIYGRYAIGLSNLNDIDERDKWKSQSIQIGVGLSLF